ncbi:MAG: hypothetical protein V4795_02685 [Pseudomonadota bacterium]
MSEWREWVTLIGAVGAFIAGAINIFWQYRDKRQGIKVMLGPVVPSIHPYTFVSVVNLGKDPVIVRDLGFILGDLSLMSFPIAVEIDEHDMSHWGTGDLRLAGRGDHMQRAMDLPGGVSGAYAITTDQRYPRVTFAPGLGRIQRIRVWIRTRRVDYLR